MNKEVFKIRLELINKNIEIYKKNIIEAVQKEEIVPAISYLLTMRDLNEQRKLIEEFIKE